MTSVWLEVEGLFNFVVYKLFFFRSKSHLSNEIALRTLNYISAKSEDTLVEGSASMVPLPEGPPRSPGFCRNRF